MAAGMMTAGIAWPRFERTEWFWVFVAVSVAAHAVFFFRSSWEHASVVVAEPAPQSMSVQLVEVRPAEQEPVVEPEPVVPPQKIAPEPVITRQPERDTLPPPPEAAVAKPKLSATKKATAVVPPKPNAPAFVEARPQVSSNRPPNYPDLARRNGWQGLCMVRVNVDAAGRAASVALARSSGYGILDQAALTAVKRWKFTPRMVRGAASASTVEVPVNFSLR
jgi:protein TonB